MTLTNRGVLGAVSGTAQHTPVASNHVQVTASQPEMHAAPTDRSLHHLSLWKWKDEDWYTPNWEEAMTAF